MKAELEKALAPSLEGREVDDRLIQEAHEKVIDFIVAKFPNIEGLRDYLDGIKFVQLRLPMSKDGRLHLRIDTTISDKVKKIARKKGTTVTAMIELYFRAVIQDEEQKKMPIIDAEQI